MRHLALLVSLVMGSLACGCVAGIPKPEEVPVERAEGEAPVAPEPEDETSPARCQGAVLAEQPNYCFDSAREACSYLECGKSGCDYAYSDPVQVSCQGQPSH